MPSCVPEIQTKAAFLPQDTCPDMHLCAPCFDPVTGDSTGLCEFNGDTPTDAPVVFDECCVQTSPAGAPVTYGTCAPAEILPPDKADLLIAETCTQEGTKCVPLEFVENPDFKFAPCIATGLLGMSRPGGCVKDCLVTGIQQSVSSQSTCPEEEICAPCTGPLGKPTGVCD